MMRCWNRVPSAVFQNDERQLVVVESSRNVPVERRLCSAVRVKRAGKRGDGVEREGQIHRDDDAKGHGETGKDMPSFNLGHLLSLPLKTVDLLALSSFSKSSTQMRRSEFSVLTQFIA